MGAIVPEVTDEGTMASCEAAPDKNGAGREDSEHNGSRRKTWRRKAFQRRAIYTGGTYEEQQRSEEQEQCHAGRQA